MSTLTALDYRNLS